MPSFLLKSCQPRTSARGLVSGISLAGLLCCFLLTGCAALSNPALQGVPVRQLPEELRGKSVEGMKTIPLNLLGQPRPDAYRVGPDDVLGVWIEGVLGERGQSPPLLPIIRLENVELPPATGFPIQVRLDGMISLPYLEPFNVKGMTLTEIEEAIRRAYEGKDILKARRARISVSLARPRTYHILVLREDAPFAGAGGQIITTPQAYGSPEYIGVTRKGTGWELILPAYHNDVITAIAKTGGLPGTDALDTVVVERNARGVAGWDMAMQDFKAHGVPKPIAGAPILQIPLRVCPGTPLPFGPNDVTLQDGDILFIPAREERLFYTGGLIPPGQHLLPRDHDLDVLEALARVRGPMYNGNYAASNFTGTLVQPGLGQPSPSLLTVVRKLPGGGTIPIRVDLAKAIRDPRERILIQPGDFLIQQETPGEATARYVTQVMDFGFIFKTFQSAWGLGTATISVPGGSAPGTIAPIGIGVAAPTPNFGTSSSVAPIGIGVTTSTNNIGGAR